MKLEWMGEYRETLEALIHYCNIYIQSYKPEVIEYKDITYSFSLIQVLEYLLENEDLNENMTEIACRLGITKSNFSKIVKRLEQKNLVTRENKGDSRKEINLVVTDLGRELYADYSQRIYEFHFKKMFKSLDQIPKEYIPLIAKALRDANSYEE